jgi:hypothetical protein
LAPRFPGLEKLARGYVTDHLDYQYGEPEDAVIAFCEDFAGEMTRSAAAGIDALFAEYPDEQARLAALLEMHWGHAPGEGMLDAFLVWTRAMLLDVTN